MLCDNGAHNGLDLQAVPQLAPLGTGLGWWWEKKKKISKTDPSVGQGKCLPPPQTSFALQLESLINWFGRQGS